MGRGGFLSRTEGNKRNYYVHKSKGLCVNCSNKSVEGRVFCQKHLEKARIYNKKRIRSTLNDK